jgi:hypothetical protein
MSMLRICSEPRCETRTLGRYCISHETASSRSDNQSTARGLHRNPRFERDDPKRRINILAVRSRGSAYKP